MSKIAASFSRDFVEGFIKRCMDQGLNAASTEDLFRKHAYTQLLSRPEIYAGFTAGLAGNHSGLTKAAMARHMSPDMVALVLDTRIKFSSDILSVQLRKELGLPEPSLDSLHPVVRDNFEKLAHSMPNWANTPMAQQVLMSTLLGSGANAAWRGIHGTEEDQFHRRGVLARMLRGAGHGAAVGAGAGLGAAGGAALGRAAIPGKMYAGGGVYDDANDRLWANGGSASMGGMLGGTAGAVAGGMAGNAVTNML